MVWWLVFQAGSPPDLNQTQPLAYQWLLLIKGGEETAVKCLAAKRRMWKKIEKIERGRDYNTKMGMQWGSEKPPGTNLC